jgi:putative transposase
MADWHHAPVHRLEEGGAYMVTAGTYRRRHLLDTDAKLRAVTDALLKLAEHYRCSLQAWAVLRNHYHFLAAAPEWPGGLRKLVKHLHSTTARRLNRLDGCPGRKVWYQYWDTRITYQRSYLARLKYVIYNPVKHGLVEEPTAYPWCSAAWFERNASPAFRKTVESFKVDRVNVFDDF